MKAAERLWVTGDRSRVVPEGDPEAAFLLAAKGQPLRDEDVYRYGIEDGRLPSRKKQKAAEEDKEIKKEEDKGGGLSVNKRK